MALFGKTRVVIVSASEAIQRCGAAALDRHVASLLAMTVPSIRGLS
jgi:hypothetical protein